MVKRWASRGKSWWSTWAAIRTNLPLDALLLNPSASCSLVLLQGITVPRIRPRPQPAGSAEVFPVAPTTCPLRNGPQSNPPATTASAVWAQRLLLTLSAEPKPRARSNRKRPFAPPPEGACAGKPISGSRLGEANRRSNSHTCGTGRRWAPRWSSTSRPALRFVRLCGKKTPQPSRETRATCGQPRAHAPRDRTSHKRKAISCRLPAATGPRPGASCRLAGGNRRPAVSRARLGLRKGSSPATVPLPDSASVHVRRKYKETHDFRSEGRPSTSLWEGQRGTYAGECNLRGFDTTEPVLGPPRHPNFSRGRRLADTTERMCSRGALAS